MNSVAILERFPQVLSKTNNGIYRGFNLPIFLRTQENFSDQYFTFDEERVCRRAYIPSQKFETVERVDIILFPHYSANSEKEIKQVSGTQLFKLIMDNIKFHSNQAILLKDIAKLANNSIAYEVNYNCFDWVDKLIGTT